MLYGGDLCSLFQERGEGVFYPHITGHICLPVILEGLREINTDLNASHY